MWCNDQNCLKWVLTLDCLDTEPVGPGWEVPTISLWEAQHLTLAHGFSHSVPARRVSNIRWVPRSGQLAFSDKSYKQLANPDCLASLSSLFLVLCYLGEWVDPRDGCFHVFCRSLLDSSAFSLSIFLSSCLVTSWNLSWTLVTRTHLA